jgi:hypothetical protein
MIKEMAIMKFETHHIWTNVQIRTSSQTVPSHPLSIDTVEFGILSQKSITDTLMDVFKAEYSVANGKRTLTFTQENLQDDSSSSLSFVL